MTTSAKDFFKNGTGHIVSSSHNDIAWWNTPYKTMEYRDLHIISPAIDMVAEDPEFKHTMECVLYLMEYLQRHPEKKDQLHQMALEGRFQWGATYTQPYDGMLNNEALVRQVYLGKKWMQKIFPGTNPRVAWSPDVPGRTMQFSQVLAKAGIEYAMISRVDAGAFEWFSPDGSSVKGFSPGHYFTSAKALNNPLDIALEKVDETLTSARPHYESHNLPPEYLFLSVADYIAPHNYRNLITSWPDTIDRSADIPRLKHSTAEEFMDALTSNPTSTFKTYRGERSNEWAYIHGATHHIDLAYGRKAADTMPEAELFATINCVLENDFSSYPSELIEEGWKHILYADHGFGGGNGHITDKVFGNAMKRGLDYALSIRDTALKTLAQKVKVPLEGLPIIVFNSQSYTRTDVVNYALDIRTVPSRYFKIIDDGGRYIPYQFIDENNAFEMTIAFVASAIPSMGYRTYRILPCEEAPETVWLKATHKQISWLAENENKTVAPQDMLLRDKFILENEFYKLTITKGGITSLFDKDLDLELIDNTYYSGFELFMMESKGTGAGEFEAIQQPTFHSAAAMSTHNVKWEQIEDGPIRTVIQVETPFEHCHVIQKITLYHLIKKIACDIDLISFDGTPYKEYRLALPLNFTDAQLAYDVPMGTVEIGKDEVQEAVGTSFFKGINVIHYPTPCTEIHPREVQNWMSATSSHSNATVVMSSDVSMFDYINPMALQSDKPMLQPILLASRRSCHGWGNEYLQRGNHSYHFSLTSFKGDWRGTTGTVEATNTPLLPIAITHPTPATQVLPTRMSFYSTSDPGVVISAVKKCEDDDHVIIRTFENHGKASSVTLSCFGEVSQIKLTTIIEEELKTISHSQEAHLTVAPRSIDTFKVML